MYIYAYACVNTNIRMYTCIFLFVYLCMVSVFPLDTVCFSESSYTVKEGSNLNIKLVANKRLTANIDVRLRYDHSLTASGK